MANHFLAALDDEPGGVLSLALPLILDGSIDHRRQVLGAHRLDPLGRCLHAAKPVGEQDLLSGDVLANVLKLQVFIDYLINH